MHTEYTIYIYTTYIFALINEGKINKKSHSKKRTQTLTIHEIIIVNCPTQVNLVFCIQRHCPANPQHLTLPCYGHPLLVHFFSIDWEMTLVSKFTKQNLTKIKVKPKNSCFSTISVLTQSKSLPINYAFLTSQIQIIYILSSNTWNYPHLFY